MTGLTAIALDYIAKDWRPIPLPYGEKKAVSPDWPKWWITAAEAPRRFNGAGNIGVILGEPSGHLVDLDLDCDEALALAPAFLPPSEAAFGRQSKRHSHLLYTSPVGRTAQFTDPDDGTMLLEVRSTGGQTVFPGSTHETGEPVEWELDGEPTPVDADRLLVDAKQLAAACLLLRAAPAENRHMYLLTVAGVLVRGLGEAGAAHVLAPVARRVLGGLYNKAEGDRLIADTRRKLDQGPFSPKSAVSRPITLRLVIAPRSPTNPR